jgi:hypothetical protein
MFSPERGYWFRLRLAGLRVGGNYLVVDSDLIDADAGSVGLAEPQ